MLVYSDLKEMPKALVKMQNHLENPIKDSSGYNYKYAQLDQLIALIKPVLSDYGFTVIQAPYSSENRVGVETMLIHESGEFIKFTLDSELSTGQTKGCQAVGSQISYYRRYSILSLFNLAQEDDDGQTASKPQKNKKAMATKDQKIEINKLLGDAYFDHADFIENKMTFDQAQKRIQQLRENK
jgi:hypothetical protein